MTCMVFGDSTWAAKLRTFIKNHWVHVEPPVIIVTNSNVSCFSPCPTTFLAHPTHFPHALSPHPGTGRLSFPNRLSPADARMAPQDSHSTSLIFRAKRASSHPDCILPGVYPPACKSLFSPPIKSPPSPRLEAGNQGSWSL